ncbi:putative RNA-directed DNA polymerase from transposon X-element [Trichonephila clavipes]|nr:putative RNA-directed DNA polymerase from transposon X-element [Trichonephila clavipes]
MARGCFNLRGWKSNVPGRYIFRSSGVTSLLGLLWDLDQDTLKCNLNYSEEGEISKRNVLAMVHKIFDPLGILSPTTLLPKWRDEIVYLEKVNIPRYVEINENSELHLFVDACKSSYGACVYIRTVTPLVVKIRLIRAKSRVAPLKTMIIPRLELMACCIGARLVHSVYAALDVPDLKIIAWSDSMVALWWLKNHGDWSVFVANRGPSWLLEPPSNWPIDRLACETSEVEREKRKVRLCNLVAVEGEISWPLTYLSENSDDLVPLSPAMFLVENRNLDVPDIDYRDTVNLRKRVRYRQKLLNDLKHRFRKEYLDLLIQNKNKKGPLSEVRLGEIVLIGDDIKKRMHWPLAKVIRLIPGKDGKIRTVELKTRTGTMLRPIQRVYPLEVQTTETPNDPLNDCTITNPISSISSDNLSDPNDSSNVLPRVSKYRRVIKVPEKLDLFNQVLYVFESK